MRPHDHGGGDQPHHHLFAKEALVTVPQDEYELMRKAAALAHAPTCEHLQSSYERSGAGAPTGHPRAVDAARVGSRP